MYIKKMLRIPSLYPYESLGSFYFRLANKNYTDVKTLNKRINCFNSKYLSYYNQIKDERILSNIGIASNLDINKIKEMTIHSFNFWDKDYKTFFERITYNNESRYCPQCLKEHTYHRIYWQLMPIEICLKHEIFLLDKCKKCDREITIDDIVKDQCICGTRLSQCNGRSCNDDLIIQVQKKLYKAFGIEESVLNDYSSDLLGYRNNQVIVIIVFIKWFIESNWKAFKKIGLFENDNLDIQQNCLKSIGKILSNYPNCFIELLDMINDNIMEFINESNLRYNLFNLTNPLYCINLVKNYPFYMDFIQAINYLQFFNGTLFNYYKDRYNAQFFKKRMKMLRNSFESTQFYNYFKYANMTIDNNIVNYLEATNIEDIKIISDYISEYMKYFVENGELITNKIGYISVAELVEIYKPFKITLLEVLGEIKRREINASIFPLSDGLGSIYVPEIVTKKALLKLALKKLD